MTDHPLIAFLHARLDEDEALARQAAHEDNPEWEAIEGKHEEDGLIRRVMPAYSPDIPWTKRWIISEPHPYPEDEAVLRHLARHDPAWVLREVAAKRRRIAALAEAADRDVYITAVYTADDALRDEAAVYSDHADYRAEWAPGADT